MEDASLALPDAPGVTAASSSSLDSQQAVANSGTTTDQNGGGFKYFLSHSNSIVFAGETRPPLTSRQKVVLGFQGAVSPFAISGWVLSAGWSQLRNGPPNYGVDKGAYGQRLGATAIRNTSQNIFGNAVLAPLLHEDPRYYEMGSGHNFFKRGIYAATRVLVTRTDSGRSTPNISLIGGDLAGVALANAYYPPINQGFKETAMSFGTSLGGSAIGMVCSEFYDDVLRWTHLK